MKTKGLWPVNPAGGLSGEGCYERPRPGGAWLSRCGEALRGPIAATGTESEVSCGLEVLSWSPEDLETDQSMGCHWSLGPWPGLDDWLASLRRYPWLLAEGWASVTCRPSLKSAVVWRCLAGLLKTGDWPQSWGCVGERPVTCPVKAAMRGCDKVEPAWREKINHRRLGEVAVLTLSQSEQHEALLRRKIGQIRYQPK